MRNAEGINLETVRQLVASDLERHERMLQRFADAQQIQAQIDLLAARQQELLAAYKIWCEDLHERYELATDGSENVAPDGTITRRHNDAGPTTP